MELNERVAKCETEINNIKERVNVVEDTTKAIYQINANMERMFGEMKDLKQDSIKATDEIKEDIKGIKSDLSDVKKEVDLVKEVPSKEKAKKWDEVTWKITLLLITGGAMYLLGMAFPFIK